MIKTSAIKTPSNFSEMVNGHFKLPVSSNTMVLESHCFPAVKTTDKANLQINLEERLCTQKTNLHST